jgi:hypothetical protein
MVLADLRILLVTPVGFTKLLSPAFLPAFPAAVDLTSITRTADEKHHAATDCPAKQLSKRIFRRHCSRGGVDNDGFSWQAELHLLLWFGFFPEVAINKTPTVPAVGVFSFSASGSLL